MMSEQIPGTVWLRPSWIGLTMCVVSAWIAVTILRLTYFAFFHPLACHPGPRLWSISRLPWAYHTIKGDVFRQTANFHNQYGPVVRIAPDELSFVSPESWRDIYMAKPELRKDPYSMTPPLNGADSLFTAEGESHKRIRRVFIGAFSDKALREQSEIIEHYAHLLIDRLRSIVSASSSVTLDIQPAIGDTTFDTISDLTWGEEPREGRNVGHGDWNRRFFLHAQFSTIRNCLSRFSPAHKLLHYIFLHATSSQRNANTRLTTERIKRRLAMSESRPDFMAAVVGKISNDPHKGISLDEVLTNGLAVVIANSQLTSIAVCVSMYLLLKAPEKLSRLMNELESVGFQDEAQITVESTRSLPYLQAVINEALRIHHPTPINLPRVVPKGGMMVADRFVPGHCVVGVNLHNIHTSPENFRKPLEFHPERFLQKSDARFQDEFVNDRLEAFNPFSRGPRNCIGYNVFLAQSRVSLARLFWTFRFELDDPCDTAWLDQKGWLVYEPKELLVRLRPNRH